MRLSFVKMHGLGNDYILFDASDCAVEGIDLGQLAKDLCRRRFSIGADGIAVLSMGGADADIHMRVFNPDGSEAGSCGTAFRCAARYAFERKGFAKATTSGVRIATSHRNVLARIVQSEDDRTLVEVRMGKALFGRGDIPAVGPGDEDFLEQPIAIQDEELTVSAVSVGNPHAVVFCDDASNIPLTRLGPAIENHPVFPRRTNVHFVQIISRSELKVRTWERGTGPTLSCGTGASAAVAIASRLGKVDTPVQVQMPGGILKIDVDQLGEITMLGEAEPVFSGWIEYEA